MNNVIHWGWALAFGIILIILGSFAIAVPYIATFASILVLGWLLLVSGVLQFIYAFRVRYTESFLMHILISLFNVVVGILVIANPKVSALAITLLLAAFFLSVGLFKMISAVVMRFQYWVWVFLGGLLSVFLGVLIWMHWPASALWVIGLFIGIDMIFTGWTLLVSAIIVKNLKKY